ncbi:MAG: sigma-70 family RNA polymerase sigma factor [Clostridia bacterium]|nr:sigma-70 family RNA polymerase sigma factor [Clostridia bacterium]
MSSEIINNLVVKAKEGNIEAFGILYETYSKDMYKFAFYYLGSPTLAEDCVSECVLTAFQKINTLKKTGSFKSWLFKILYNCCNKALKEKIRARDTVEISSLIDLCKEDSDQSEIISLKNSMEKLTEEEKTIILLSYTAGYTSKEIGKILGLKDSTVRSKLMRSTEKLRQMLHTDEVIR